MDDHTIEDGHVVNTTNGSSSSMHRSQNGSTIHTSEGTRDSQDEEMPNLTIEKFYAQYNPQHIMKKVPHVELNTGSLSDLKNRGSQFMNLFFAISALSPNWIELNLPITLEMLIATYHIEGVTEAEERPTVLNRVFNHIPMDTLHSYNDIKQLIKQYLYGISKRKFVNMVLLGNKGSGKTTLKKLIESEKKYEERPPTTKKLESTKGIKLVRSKKFRTKIDDEKYDDEIILDIYDTPGHTEGFMPMLSLSSSLYIIVADGATYDSENFQETIGRYIDLIYLWCKECYFMVVLSKRDVSSSNAAHIDRLQSQITEYIANLDKASIKFKNVHEISSIHNSMLVTFTDELKEKIGLDEEKLFKFSITPVIKEYNSTLIDILYDRARQIGYNIDKRQLCDAEKVQLSLLQSVIPGPDVESSSDEEWLP